MVYIICSCHFRLSVYTWGIFLTYIHHRFSSRLHFYVFWEAGRDDMHSHNGWSLPMPSGYSYPLPPTSHPFDPWIAPTALSGHISSPLIHWIINSTPMRISLALLLIHLRSALFLPSSFSMLTIREEKWVVGMIRSYFMSSKILWLVITL